MKLAALESVGAGLISRFRGSRRRWTSGWTTRVAALLLLSLLVACSGHPGQACSYWDLKIQTDDGASDTCFGFAQQLEELRTDYALRFGSVYLIRWVIHVSSDANPYTDGSGAKHGAETDWAHARILIGNSSVQRLFAHELMHVQLGPGSVDHAEPIWCAQLSPWEIQKGLEDERAYLGCQ